MLVLRAWKLGLLLVVATCAFLGRGAEVALETAFELGEERFKGWTYGSGGARQIDCVQFVVQVVEELAEREGRKLSLSARRGILISNLNKKEREELQFLVERGTNRKVRGIQSALVEAGFGRVVLPDQVEPGDFVQYWYRDSGLWKGHAGLIESVEDGVATIFGSHKTTLQRERHLPLNERQGGVGSGPRIDLDSDRYRVFIVRWDSP